MRNILITGGAGFIGSNLALQLIDKGYSITVLDNLSKQIHGINPEESFLYKSIKDKVKFIYGSVTVKDDWVKALYNQDAVIHFAAETGTGQSMYEIHKYIDVNMGGTAHLLDILSNQEHTIKKIIVASSRAIYGEGRYFCKDHKDVYPGGRKEEDMLNKDFDCKCPVCNEKVDLLSTNEESKIQPESVYAISKFNQEQLLLLMGKSLNIPVVSFRYQNVFGPGQSLSNPYTGILSIFSNQLRKNNPINIFEDGKESRDFVYIDDVIQATILGLENIEANFKCYNVGTGIATNVLEIANTLLKSYNSTSKITISGNFRIGDIRHNYADLTKIKRDLGYEPKFDFAKGVKHFSEWVTSQESIENNYAESIEEMKSKRLLK